MTIENERILLSALWVALMFAYLLGDVLRIFSGDTVLGEISGVRPSQAMWLGIAIFMTIPIVMLLLSLVVAHPAVRWINIGAAGLLFVFNLVGLPTYPSAYDKYLIVVGLVLNALTVGLAWNWR